MAIGDIKALHDRAAASLLLGSIGVFALVDLNRRRVRTESQIIIGGEWKSHRIPDPIRTEP